jgi:predicted DNA-binding transcriptional regulator YafY
LLHAIRAHHPISLTYLKFAETPTESKYDLEPYLLKEYRNRWYLLGWDPGRGHIRTFGCDRIRGIVVKEAQKFQVQPTFDARNYFEHAMGITVLGDGTPEDVAFRCDPLLAKYLTSQPLHHSQSMDLAEDGQVTVRLRVMPTFELLQWLQAHASELTLLQPESIRDSVVANLKNALERQKISGP